MVYFLNLRFINKLFLFSEKNKVYAHGPVYKTQNHRRKITREDAKCWTPPRFISCLLIDIVKLCIHVCVELYEWFLHSCAEIISMLCEISISFDLL